MVASASLPPVYHEHADCLRRHFNSPSHTPPLSPLPPPPGPSHPTLLVTTASAHPSSVPHTPVRRLPVWRASFTSSPALHRHSSCSRIARRNATRAFSLCYFSCCLTSLTPSPSTLCTRNSQNTRALFLPSHGQVQSLTVAPVGAQRTCRVSIVFPGNLPRRTCTAPAPLMV